MTGTVDVVIVGAHGVAVAATIDAVRRGLTVLVVIRSRAAKVARRLRRSAQSAGVTSPKVTILTGSEIACVDGVNATEAVVVRRLGTGQLLAFNASSVLHFGTVAKCRDAFASVAAAE